MDLMQNQQKNALDLYKKSIEKTWKTCHNRTIKSG